MQRQHGEQTGIARAGPDEPDMPGFEIRKTEERAVNHVVDQAGHEEP